MAAVIWTLICMAGLAVWGGIAADSWHYWTGLRKENPLLGSAYFRELLGDSVIFGVLAFWTLIGALALVAPGIDGFGAIAILVGLFSGPVGLTLLGLWRYWRRRQAR